MNKTEIKIGATIDSSLLSVAEKVEKEKPYDGECTHVNVLVPTTKARFEEARDDANFAPILIHAGTSTLRYKNFLKEKIVARPVIANIFYSQT